MVSYEKALHKVAGLFILNTNYLCSVKDADQNTTLNSTLHSLFFHLGHTRTVDTFICQILLNWSLAVLIGTKHVMC
jgi:hypothetical protein